MTINTKSVELVYALPEMQYLETIEFSGNQTIQNIICLSSLQVHFPDLDYRVLKVGVFGQVRQLDSMVESGDRIEIYRALTLSPTEARKLRAETKKRGD